MTKENPTATRRDFLKLAGTSVPAGAAALAVGSTADAAEVSDTGLPNTEHTKKYLDSARF